MKKTKLIIIIWAMITTLCLTIPFRGKVIASHNIGKLLDKTFSFGTPSGIYDHDVTIKLSANIPFVSGIQTYYTYNIYDENTSITLYENPIVLSVEDVPRIVTITASVMYDGEFIGGPYEESYLLCRDKAVFENLPVINIRSAPSGLYDPQKGILYPEESLIDPELWGRDGSAFIREKNYGKDGDEWVRYATADIFGRNGKRVISQPCGLSVGGNYGSLLHYPFSLKIKADTTYDPDGNRFYYDIFDEWNSSISSAAYDGLKLKNGGNDYMWDEDEYEKGQGFGIEGCMLRNALGLRLAKELGLYASPRCTGMVFLNGELYNVVDINASENPKTISASTGLNDSEIQIFKGSEISVLTELDIKGNYHSYPDLSDSDIFDEMGEFEARVDVDELLKYYAFECIINNTDWPEGNWAVWKYTGEYNPADKRTDGKIRPIPFDLDFAYDPYPVEGDCFELLLEDYGNDSCLLAVLMQVPKYREAFIKEVRRQLDSPTFDEDHIISVINEENEVYSRCYALFHNPETIARRQVNVDRLKELVLKRRQEVEKALEKYLS